MTSKVVSRKQQPSAPNGISDLRELTRWVKVLQPNELALFDRLFTGKIKTPGTPKKNITDENRFSNVKEVIDSTTDEQERASRLLNLVTKLEGEITEIITQSEAFERAEEERAKIQHMIDTKFMSIFDACLLIREGRDYQLINSESEQEKAKNLIEKYCSWEYSPSISTKLPKFEINNELETDYSNTALFQQLAGKLPPAPIAHQILTFSLLDWQYRMFMKLKDGYNVICCAPTSSGKTMIALGFIYAFLTHRPKSLLVYLAPNNVLAMEIAAILNKYVPNLVSTLLDDKCERKQDERVVVSTPTGAFTHGFHREKIPDTSFLVVDEVHCIGNTDGVNMEYCLRYFSKVQTLILSATMTQNTINKLKDAIRNKFPTHEINETTRFMIPQHIIPKKGSGSDGEGDVKLVPLNPVGSIKHEDLFNPHLDIPMTPRDILGLYVKIYRTFEKSVPSYLHPIRFFFIHHGRKPEVIVSLEEIEENEVEVGEIRRLNLDDFAAWQKALLDFLAHPPAKNVEAFEGEDENESGEDERSGEEKWKEAVLSILDSYKLSLTDESTCECSLENAFKLVEKLKTEHMLQALFFFPNPCRAFKYATYIFNELAKKPLNSNAAKKDKDSESRLEALRKQLSSLERLKLKKGADVKDLKERKYQLQDEISNLESSSSKVQAYHSLAENIICGEDFDKLVQLMKKWNNNITLSSPLCQMIIFGVGVLSGDMPYDLQVFIRKLYACNSIAILMVTEDCAYGINTPTKTVVLSDGFTESQRRQMAGRAGRKGISTNAWVIYFRLNSVEEAGQKLTDLRGGKLVLHVDNRLPSEERWITKVEHNVHPYAFTKEQFATVSSFYLKTRTVFGHAAIMAPFVLDAVLKNTVDQTNRHICTILAVTALSPYNRPYATKEGWNYEFPVEVKRLFETHGFRDILPNYVAYLWLTNQVNDLPDEQIEELVDVSRYWSYLFLLLETFFPEKDKKLYQQIQDIIVVSNIRTSTAI